MNWILPGTVLEVDGSRPEAADELFSSLFVTGGLVLSQVCQITGLEPYAVQNWVKRGFLAPPWNPSAGFCPTTTANWTMKATTSSTIA